MKAYSFFNSPEHENWLRKCADEMLPRQKYFQNYVTLSGNLVPYTTCRAGANATEPWDGALIQWPDYRKLGVANR